MTTLLEKMNAGARFRLRRSLESITERADFKATQKIIEADKQVTGNAAIFSKDKRQLAAVGLWAEEIDAALKEVFTAYNAERNRLWFGHHVLDDTVSKAVRAYYGGLDRFAPREEDWWGVDRQEFLEALRERQHLTMSAVEEHFRHPGILPPHQRYAIAFAVVMALLGAALTVMGRKFFP